MVTKLVMRILPVLFLVGVAIFAYILGNIHGMVSVREEAVKAGHAVVVAGDSGKAEFRWLNCGGKR